MSTVREVCACGATFDYTSRESWTADADCRIAVKQWREQHRHEMPAPQPEPPQLPELPEIHDTQLDALVERTDNEPDHRAELDSRPRLGFRP